MVIKELRNGHARGQSRPAPDRGPRAVSVMLAAGQCEQLRRKIVLRPQNHGLTSLLPCSPAFRPIGFRPHDPLVQPFHDPLLFLWLAIVPYVNDIGGPKPAETTNCPGYV